MFNPWLGKIPHDAGVTKPMSPNYQLKGHRAYAPVKEVKIEVLFRLQKPQAEQVSDLSLTFLDTALPTCLL